MSELTEEQKNPPRKRRRSVRQMAIRELKIVELMAGGVSVREIALRERLSERRVREIVAHALSRRERLAGPEFLELQVRRLSEALLISYGTMKDGDLKAVDRVVTIVRELDRYHGLSPRGAAPPPRLEAAPPLALEAAPAPMLESPAPPLALEAAARPLETAQNFGPAIIPSATD